MLFFSAADVALLGTGTVKCTGIPVSVLVVDILHK